jgi:hypothetical protein
VTTKSTTQIVVNVDTKLLARIIVQAARLKQTVAEYITAGVESGVEGDEGDLAAGIDLAQTHQDTVS